jgi:hypothetical protein
MPVELALLLAAAESVTGFAAKAAPVVSEIKSSMFANNEKAKAELQAKIDGLETDLQNVAKLTHVIRAYFRTHENVLKLTAICERTSRFVQANADLRDREAAGYAGAWSVLGEMFAAIDENRDAALEVSLNVAEWYSTADAAQIPTLLNQFTSAFDRARENMREKTASPLADRLDEMRNSLRSVETVLEATMNNQVLPTLQGLGGK